jgi:hypothetical protein
MCPSLEHFEHGFLNGLYPCYDLYPRTLYLSALTRNGLYQQVHSRPEIGLRLASRSAKMSQEHQNFTSYFYTPHISATRAVISNLRTALHLRSNFLQNGFLQFAFRAFGSVAQRCATMRTGVCTTMGTAANQHHATIGTVPIDAGVHMDSGQVFLQLLCLDNAPSVMAPRLATLRAAANQRHSVMAPGSITEGVHMDRTTANVRQRS